MNRNIKINPLTLTFEGYPKLEKRYLQKYKDISKTMVQLAIITGTSIIASFYIIDYYLFYPIHEKLFFWRTANILVAVALFFYSFVINKKSNYLFWVSFLGPLLTAIIHTKLLGIAEYNVHMLYFPGMILILMYNSCFMRQRFIHASVSSLIMLTYFMIEMFLTLGLNSDFFLMNMFIFSSVFVGLWVSYLLEYSSRKQFILTEQLKSAVEDRKEIYKVVVHDLKNPTSIIKSQILLLKTAKKIEQKYSKRILSSVDRMMYLLDHLLKYCEIEDHQIELEFKEYNIPEIMDICLENNSLYAESKGIELCHNCQNISDFITYLDAFKVQEVFDNIISNAIKYSSLDSKVEISYGEEESYYKIFIKDQGQGISEDELPKVFDKFTKLSSKPTGGETSNGLGLSLSKNLMEIQGGDITCSSTLNKGTLFTIYIAKREKDLKAA